MLRFIALAIRCEATAFTRAPQSETTNAHIRGSRVLYLIAVAVGFGVGLSGVRRFLERRYPERYASEELEFQDPVVLPGFSSTGGIEEDHGSVHRRPERERPSGREARYSSAARMSSEMSKLACTVWTSSRSSSASTSRRTFGAVVSLTGTVTEAI